MMADDITTEFDLTTLEFDPTTLVEQTPEEKAAAQAQAQTPEAPEKTPETPETPETTSETPEETPESTPKNQPGTPDKVLQSMQQDLSATQRKLDVLLEKVESGETLTRQEQQQVIQQKRKLDDLREKLAGKMGAIIDNEDLLVDTLGEVDASVQALARQNEQLRAEMDLLRQQSALIQAQQAWAEIDRKYPNIATRDIWKKALEEASATLGDDVPFVAVHRMASKLFHDRCAIAVKSLTAKTSKTPTPTPPVTPGGARTTTTNNSVTTGEQLTPEQQYVRLAESLVVD